MTADDPPPDSAAAPPARSPAVPMLLALQLLTGIVVAPALAFFPVYLKDLGLSAVLISGIVTIQRVMGLGSSLAGGALVDTIGAKRTLVAGQVLYFAATLLFLTCSPWWIAV
ncbi:MAG: MFS transporter, partial [Spirochaetes bacterium]|nr:MFS transporter [Spirochaetota bacterium]